MPHTFWIVTTELDLALRSKRVIGRDVAQAERRGFPC